MNQSFLTIDLDTTTGEVLVVTTAKGETQDVLIRAGSTGVWLKIRDAATAQQIADEFAQIARAMREQGGES